MLVFRNFEQQFFYQRLDLGLEISDIITKRAYWTEVVRFLPLTWSNWLKMNIKFHNGSADRFGIILHNLICKFIIRLLHSEWEKDNFVNSINMINSDVGLSDGLFLDVENSGMNSCTIVKGHLRECISFWESIGANRWVLEIIREGYCLPFVDLPESMTFLNHQSAVREADFVAKEIDKLLQSGALVEVEVQDREFATPWG